ncbi:helix-turn-helix transcriptional regulator [Clostridium sp. 'deep sea']|uniref:helix-turn-helix transcriptional regulator n=1 Tax=Clostridium sp. 'deep sea' TaxID=2779445 RepID=UPI0018965D1B|nr:AraC family transcriptional regulator [Clostridium sp. 'deep sea']QOR34643.1 helix-turn-helix transcriptional regulator [Clostridium sp. 'deep sea']
MNDIKKDSFFLNKMATLNKTTKNYTIHTILPKYGKGTITIFNIIPGLKVVFNDLMLQGKIVNCFSKYKTVSQGYLKIEYCLKGSLLSSNQENKVFLGSKGIAMYYQGTGNVRAMVPYDKHYESITFLGYSNEIIKVFKEIFQVDKNFFADFYKMINKGKAIVVKYNSTVKSLLNEIKQAIYNNDNEIMRLKAIELVFYEVKNFDKNKRFNVVYYNRSTIDKVIIIKSYIIKNLDKKITINYICDRFNISANTLKGCFKQTFLTSIYAYIKQARMEKGKESLENSDKSIMKIALDCGYSNHHSFAKAFKQHYNITPSDVRNLHQ